MFQSQCFRPPKQSLPPRTCSHSILQLNVIAFELEAFFRNCCKCHRRSCFLGFVDVSFSCQKKNVLGLSIESQHTPQMSAPYVDSSSCRGSILWVCSPELIQGFAHVLAEQSRPLCFCFHDDFCIPHTFGDCVKLSRWHLFFVVNNCSGFYVICKQDSELLHPCCRQKERSQGHQSNVRKTTFELHLQETLH